MAEILAVDDDAAILRLIGKILEKDGHRVTAVTDSSAVGRMALERFGLILLDVMMPGTDGYALCEEIRSRVDCPILFLTARSEESSLVLGLEKGADDYICKPFGAAELRARVAAHLRRERREHFAGLVFEKSRFHFPAQQLIVNENVVPLYESGIQYMRISCTQSWAGLFEGADL